MRTLLSACMVLAFSGMLMQASAATTTTPTLEQIDVTPVVSRIAAGQTQAFTATGLFSDGSEQPLAAQAIQFAAGQGHSCVLLGDSTVHCWGINDYDQLGSRL